MTIVRWGIIGCGDVTEVKSGPALQNASNSELVAVMRRNGALAHDYAQRHGVPRWYDNADDLLNDPEVDAVFQGDISIRKRPMMRQRQELIFIREPVAQ